MNFLSTLKGSLLEDFYPKGWNFEKIDECCNNAPEDITKRQKHWNKGFLPVECLNVDEFNMMLGHEIAHEIAETKKTGRKLALILPVGPMGMYKWIVYFLKEWEIDCKHVCGFNMDEWSDGEGNTFLPGDSASFQYAMEQAFYNPLGKLTVPKNQRNFATKSELPAYPKKIAALKRGREDYNRFRYRPNVPYRVLGASICR